MKKIMTGNEAIAYGAYLAGVRVGSAYPGTPATEIMERLAAYPGIYAEWAPNEKVALDVGIGAAYAGSRALVSMKHVGLNVAADALFYAVYTGVPAGLVIACADDPFMYSSQNEQDNRNYAKFAKLPVLEPADSEEAKQFTAVAFDLSEQFDTPVMLRSVTRISHSASPVELSSETPPPPAAEPPLFARNAPKYVMVPANARHRHAAVEERLARLAAFADTFPHNRLEAGDPRLGIIAAGTAYQYAREIFPRASFLKLGLVYPLPQKLIREFASRVEKLLVIEELDPFLEEQISLMGIAVQGRDIFPRLGEFSPALVRRCARQAGLLEPPSRREDAADDADTAKAGRPAGELPVRPPTLCPGCGHRGLFYVLRELGVLVHGDIGCYTLAFAPPLNAMHTTGCMGASIGVAHGVAKAGVQDRIVAVIGDSTFLHSGLHPLINVQYNRSNIVTVITDNCVTAMTGAQHHPGTGTTLQNQQTRAVKLEELVRGIGIDHVDICDPYDLTGLRQILEKHLGYDQPSVIIARRPCVIYTRERNTPPRVNAELCVDCGACLELGCPPLIQQEDCVGIDPLLCNGCGLCIQVCPAGAIERAAGPPRAEKQAK